MTGYYLFESNIASKFLKLEERHVCSDCFDREVVLFKAPYDLGTEPYTCRVCDKTYPNHEYISIAMAWCYQFAARRAFSDQGVICDECSHHYYDS